MRAGIAPIAASQTATIHAARAVYDPAVAECGLHAVGGGSGERWLKAADQEHGLVVELAAEAARARQDDFGELRQG